MPTVTRQVGQTLWHVDGEFASALFPAEGGGLAEALAGGAVEAVKGGAGRRTVVAEVGGRRFYVKQYDGSGGASRARREWRMARRAWGQGLATPRPVAAAWHGGAAYVTADAGPAVTLSDLVYDRYFEATEDEPPYPGHRPPELVRLYRRRVGRPVDVPTPRELGRMAAELLIELHSLGLHHRDLHPGNILITAGDGLQAAGHGNGDSHGHSGDHDEDNGNDNARRDKPAVAHRLMLLDLGELEEASGREAVADHLVQLNHFFEPLATRSERLSVLRLLEDRGLRFFGEAAQLEVATWAYRRRFYRGRDRRCLRESKYFGRVDLAPLAGIVVADLAGQLPRSATEVGQVIQIREPVKESRREVSGFGTLGGRRVFIKQDRPAGWRAAGRPWPAVLEAWLRGTRQKRAWQRANALLNRGILVARPLVWLDRRRGLMGCEGILVSEALDGWASLDVSLPAQKGLRRASLVESVAREVRRMHQAGMSNRDLKAQNILLQWSGGRWRVALVDMVGVRRHRRAVSLRRRMQNVMRLAFSWSGVGVSGQAVGLSRADRLRFLKTYLGPQVRQAITVRTPRRPARAETELLRRWWRGLAFALAEKAERSEK